MSSAVMPRCSYDERADAVSDALEKMILMRQEGHEVGFGYWVEFLKYAFLQLRSPKSGKRGNEMRLYGHNEENGEEFNYLDFMGRNTPARQFANVEAREALGRCRRLPKKHQAVIFRRADGAHPGEIAEELQMEMADVLDVLREARKWLEGDYV